MDIEEEDQELIKKLAILEQEKASLEKSNQEFLQKIEHLEKEKENLLLDIEHHGIAMLNFTSEGQITGANSHALRMTKYELDELYLRKIDELFIDNQPQIQLLEKNKLNADELITEQILLTKNKKKRFVQTITKQIDGSTYKIVLKKKDKRKKAEIALTEAQNRYKLLADSMQDVVWTAGADLKIIFISASISKLTGFNPETYYKKPLKELITPISYKLLLEMIRKEKELLIKNPKIKNEYPKTIEVKLLQKRDSSLWTELSVSPFFNHHGELAGFQGLIKNIEEQRKIRQSLERSHMKYNFAIRTTGSGLWELNADLTKINIDENLLNILGYTKSQTKSLLNEWIFMTWKDDRKMVIDILQDLLDHKKSSATYECRRLHKSGKTIWFTDYVEAIKDNEGNITELLGTSKNINTEKLTEEKKIKYYAGLQMLIESTFHFLTFDTLEKIYEFTGETLLKKIPDSIIFFNDVNESTYELKPFKYFGIKEPELNQEFEKYLSNQGGNACLLSKKALNFLKQKFLIEFKERFEGLVETVLPGEICQAISRQFPAYRLYIIGIGSNNLVRQSISIITKNNQELPGKEFIEAFVSLSSIIIDKKRTEIELKKTNETKDKFFSIISHDLKNPFNTFIGFSGLIIENIEKLPQEKILNFVKLIQKTALHSYEMMQNLFDWVNSQKGNLVCNPVAIDLEDIIQSHINLHSSDARNKEIELNHILSHTGDFYADKDMISAILRNLISNAIKFTYKQGKVIIGCEKTPDGAVLFSVKDTGAGIPKEKQPGLFNLSTKNSTPGTEKEKGTGLGLLICHEFVELHGGKIWVESEAGKGSIFYFSIPQPATN
jgi:PAS domain S-box-containing protein